MKIAEIPFAVLRLQYRIARTPLQLFEDRVVANMDSEAPGRLLFERCLGAVDAAIGRALGDRELESRGEALADRSEALAQAIRLDEIAARTKEQAEEALREQREQAAAAPAQVHAIGRERTEQIRTDATERKQAAVRAAAQRTNAAKKTIDEAAADKTEAVRATKRDEERRTAVAEQAATAVADAQLDDAADKRREASLKLAHADRVEELAEAEKDGRRRTSGQALRS